MGALEIIALAAVAGWLGLFSLVTLLNTRQIAILTARADHAVAVNPHEDGLPIGLEVPHDVLESIPAAQTGVILAMMSATCGPCREVAAQLDSVDVHDPIVVLLTGGEEQSAVVSALLPGSVTVVEDPLAALLAEALSVRSSPFAMRIEGGTIVAKAYISEASTFERLYRPAADVDHDRVLEVTSSVR